MRLGKEGQWPLAQSLHALPSSTWGHPGSGDLRGTARPRVRSYSRSEEELTPHRERATQGKVVMLQVVQPVTGVYKQKCTM